MVVPLKDMVAMEKDYVSFTCELSKPGVSTGKWTYDNVELTVNKKIHITTDGVKQTLTVAELTLEDKGIYKYSIQNVETSGNLTVEEWPAEFITPLRDETVMEKQTVTLECEVSKTDHKATWYKNGKRLDTNNRIQPHGDGTKHFLIISDSVLDDEAKYSIKVEEAESRCKLTVQGVNDMLSFHSLIYYIYILTHVVTIDLFPYFYRGPCGISTTTYRQKNHGKGNH